MTTLTILTATVAGLLALAFWWIRRNNLAVAPVARTARQERPGAGTAMLAATTETAAPGGGGVVPAGGGPGPAGTSRKAKRRPKHEGPSRRDFLRFGLLAAIGGGLAAFGGASLAFLWPSLRGGFGAQIEVGSEADVAAGIKEGGGQYAYPSGRAYLVPYDPALDPDGEYAEITNGAPFMALYQRCVHLGCRVPWCESSAWFECPCHGSRYNRWGEYQFGPAPRGLDRFALRVEEGTVIVDTSTVVTGPSRQGGVLQQPPEGPHCN